jgi:ribonuclease HI
MRPFLAWYNTASYNKMKQISLTTDGARIGNPGPGGWACVLRYKDHVRELRGAERNTTNNKMELRAVIEGLRALKGPCAVVVRTDSKYVRDGMTKWIHNWRSKGWVHKVKGKPGRQSIKNRELWEEVERLQTRHEVVWEWVKGHARDEDNKRCHVLANTAAHSRFAARPGRGARL